MNSDNIVARIDATFENTLQLNAELGEVTQIGKCKVLCGTTEEWNNQPELVAKEGYIYIYSDHKQNEDEQNIASFKVGDGSSLLIELPFTDDIIYEDIAALQTVVADIPTTASELPYDNSISELEATNVNDAIDEVVDMVNDIPDTASELPYDNTISGLESTNVNDAIDEVEVRVDEAEEDIVSLDTNKVDKIDPTTSGTLSHTGNATVSGTVTAQNGFVGNLTGTASSATHAVSADSATTATNASHATTADSATHATSASSADEATHATSADSATSATSATNADYATTAENATHATSADSATSATNAGNADTVNNLTVLTAVPANAVFTDTTYTLGTDGNAIKLTPSSGSAQSITAPYASNAGTVNSHSVNADVPSGAKFTDTDNLVDLKDVDFTNLTDGQVIVWDAISEKFKNITLPDAMVFRGSLGTGGTISVLPVDGSASVGDTYKVITDGTYAGQVAKVGDTFICLTKTSSANTWVHIPSGDEPSGTVTSIKIEGSGAIVIDDESAITTSGVRTISHANSGATAGSYGDSSAQTPTYGATFKVPYITVDAKGHITGISEHTVKIPESDNTDTTYTLGIDGNDLKLTPSSGSAQTITVPYATNAGTVNSHIVNKDVPSDAKFTDTNKLADLTDISLTSLQDGQILQYDSLTDTWKNENITVVASFSELSDVNLSTLYDNDVPVFNSTTQKWENRTGYVAFKDVSGTLVAGETTITLSSSYITTDSTIQYFVDTGTTYTGVQPLSITVSTGSVTLTFSPQSVDIKVMARISCEVIGVGGLNSTDFTPITSEYTTGG